MCSNCSTGAIERIFSPQNAMKKLLPICLAAIEALIVIVMFSFGTSCGPADPDEDPDYQINVLTPAAGAVVMDLTSIGGTMTTNGLEQMRCTLTRVSDGRTWNGITWDGGEMSCSEDRMTGSWAVDVSLPDSLNDPVSGLVPGQYRVTARGIYSTANGDRDVTADSAFTVGVSAPPVVPLPHAWGENTHGELGAGAGPDSNQPRLVNMMGELEGKLVLMLAAGERHSLALTSEGKVYAWGDNDRGQLGRGTGNTTPSAEPVPVDLSGVLAGKSITFIAAGDDHSLAVTSDGQVFAWGANDRGQLGNGTSTPMPTTTPVAVTMSGALNGKRVRDVTAGANFSIARTTDFMLYAWGDNLYGQLGKGDSGAGTESSVPVAVTLPSGRVFKAMDAGKAHTLAIADDNTVYAWGRGDDGRLGTGGEIQRTLPTLTGTGSVLAGKVVTSVSAGRAHSLAVAAGKLYAWGSDTAGQLGDGAGGTFLDMPVELGGALAGKTVAFIGAGGFFSIACTDDSKVFAWGENTHGNLAGATTIPTQADAPTEADFSSVLASGRRVLLLNCGLNHGLMLSGPPPAPEPDMIVDAYLNGAQYTLADGDPLSFGNHGTGSQTPLYLVVRNTGNADLMIQNADVINPSNNNASDHFFSFVPQATIPPGSTTGFYAFFEPKAAGALAAHLLIRTNANLSAPYKIVFQGTAYPSDENDPSFANAGVNGTVKAIAVQPDGKVLIGGSFTSVSSTIRNRIARLNSDGTLDATFNPDADGQVACIVVQPDGKIVLGGSFNSVGGTTRHLIARVGADGTLDTAFDPDAGTTGQVMALAFQADRQILIAGSFTTLGGSGGNGRSMLARVDATGAVDGTFTPGVPDVVRCVALAHDGRILIGGSFLTVGGESHPRVARLLSSGSVDSGFVAQVDDGQVNCISPMPFLSAVLVGGTFTSAGGEAHVNLAQFQMNGFIRSSFVPGVDGANGPVHTISVQADEDIVIGGAFTQLDPVFTRQRIARIDQTYGQLDFYFEPSCDGPVNAICLQGDGKMLIGGDFTHVGAPPLARDRLARLRNHSPRESLTVTDLTTIKWLRQGAVPLAHHVEFELSSDAGATWSSLGAGAFDSFDRTWTLFASGLPNNGLIRARAFTTGGQNGGSGSIVQTIASYGGPPEIELVSSGSVPQSNHSTRDFGVQAVGSSPVSVVFTLSNTGLGDLTGIQTAAITGPQATSFHIDQYPASTVAPGNSTPLVISFAPRTVGPQTATLSFPSNDSDESSYEITLTGYGSEPITTWRQRFFDNTINAGDAADTADSDGDGISNLLEYATGADPTTGDSLGISIGDTPSPPPALGGSSSNPPPSGGEFYFHYRRNKLALGTVTFSVEWSDTLATNDWHTTGVTEQVTTEVDNIQQVKATVPVGTEDRRFVRLKVTRQ